MTTMDSHMIIKHTKEGYYITSAKTQFFKLFESVTNSGESVQDFARWVDYKMAQFKVHGKVVKDDTEGCSAWVQLKKGCQVPEDRSQRTAAVAPLPLTSPAVVPKPSDPLPDSLSDGSDEGINKRKRRRPNRHLLPDRLASPAAASEAESCPSEDPRSGRSLTPHQDSFPPPLTICEEEKSEHPCFENISEGDGSDQVSRSPSPDPQQPLDLALGNTAFVCPECSVSFRSCQSLEDHMDTKHGSPLSKPLHPSLTLPAGIPMNSPLFNPFTDLLRPMPFPFMGPVPGIGPSPADFAKAMNMLQPPAPPQHFARERAVPTSVEKNKVKRFKPSDKSSRSFNIDVTKCPDCSNTFNQVDSLKNHMHVAHNHAGFIKMESADQEQYFMCKFCGKRFLSYGSTWRHVNGIHFRASRPCPKCHKPIGINSPLRLHWKSCTGISNEERVKLELKKDEMDSPALDEVLVAG